jgi:diguanylate cyclase (GGDEF)-like protein/PAS domain S-box-containing protein
MNEIDIFSHAPVAMAVADTDGTILRVNAALCALVGRSSEELAGRPLQSLTHPDDVGRTRAELRNLVAGAQHFQIEQQYVHASGRTLWVLLAVSLVRDRQDCPRLVVHVQDFSEQQELARRMAYLADHDALTGLFTRRRFEEALASHRHAMARYGGRGALLLIDLDRFKAVNDRFGHQAGDDVLKRVASVLRGRVRDTDVLARLGGDEFALILPQADLPQAQVVADNLIRMVRGSSSTIARKKVTVTVSVGVMAFADAAGEDPVAAADAAMYRAKRAGGDRWMAGAGVSASRGSWAASNGGQESWPRRVLASRGAQAAVGCAAALIVTTRYGFPTASGLLTAPRSLTTTLARVLAAVLTANRLT